MHSCSALHRLAGSKRNLRTVLDINLLLLLLHPVIEPDPVDQPAPLSESVPACDREYVNVIISHILADIQGYIHDIMTEELANILAEISIYIRFTFRLIHIQVYRFRSG